jgi:hypothetical protein
MVNAQDAVEWEVYYQMVFVQDVIKNCMDKLRVKQK